MAFGKGMVGVAIVVIGLFASVFLGVVLNVDRETVQRDTPVYKSDITGLYDATSEKTYVSYDPSLNYNGYSWDNVLEHPVVFKPATTANNYPMDIYSANPVNNTTTLANIGSGQMTATNGETFAFYSSTIKNESWEDLDLYMSLKTGFSSVSTTLYTIPLNTLYNILYTDAVYGSGFEVSQIDIISQGVVGTSYYLYDEADPHFGEPFVSRYFTEMGVYIVPADYYSKTSNEKQSISETYYPYSYLEQVGWNGTITYTISFIGADSFRMNVEGTNGLTNTVISYGNTSSYIAVIPQIADEYQMTYKNNGVLVDSDNQTHIYSRDEIKTTYMYDRQRSYIDPRYGVSNIPGNSTPIQWTNKYENGSIDLLLNTSIIDEDSGSPTYNQVVQKPSLAYYNQWDFYYGADYSGLNDYKFSVRVSQNQNGPMMIYVLTIDGANETYLSTNNLGMGWAGVKIHISSMDGVINVQPIPPSRWSTFLNWSSDQPVVPLCNIPQGDMNGFTVKNETEANSYRFQVANTYVFLNTYGIIMLNPSINIQKWYPNDTKYMIQFTNTAATGNSITIGGIPYSIIDQSITVPQDNKDIVIDVSELNISYYKNGNEWDIIIESPKSNTSATVSSNITEISMTGAWYFTSKYYIIELADYQEFKWEFGQLAFGWDVLLFFMMGFIGLTAILVWKFRPDLIQMMDIVIIIIAEIILFVII